MSALLAWRRDIFTVQLTRRSDQEAATQSSVDGGAISSSSSIFECPVTQLPCEKAPFGALPECGHVLSDRAIRQVCSSQTSLLRLARPGAIYALSRVYVLRSMHA
jgi:Rtf2 RING-finger